MLMSKVTTLWSAGSDEVAGAEDISEETADDIADDGASDSADDISDDISDGAEDIAEESMADDSIEDIDDSIADDSIEEEASWAITGSARTAATAVVASRVRIIVGSLGSTLVGQAARRGTWLVSGAARFRGPTWIGPSCSASLGFPSK